MAIHIRRPLVILALPGGHRVMSNASSCGSGSSDGRGVCRSGGGWRRDVRPTGPARGRARCAPGCGSRDSGTATARGAPRIRGCGRRRVAVAWQGSGAVLPRPCGRGRRRVRVSRRRWLAARLTVACCHFRRAGVAVCLDRYARAAEGFKARGVAIESAARAPLRASYCSVERSRSPAFRTELRSRFATLRVSNFLLAPAENTKPPSGGW